MKSRLLFPVVVLAAVSLVGLTLFATTAVAENLDPVAPFNGPNARWVIRPDANPPFGGETAPKVCPWTEVLGDKEVGPIRAGEGAFEFVWTHECEAPEPGEMSFMVISNIESTSSESLIVRGGLWSTEENPFTVQQTAGSTIWIFEDTDEDEVAEATEPHATTITNFLNDFQFGPKQFPLLRPPREKPFIVVIPVPDATEEDPLTYVAGQLWDEAQEPPKTPTPPPTP